MNPKDIVGSKKAPLEGVPAAGAIFAAPAHQNGADKYGPFNWRVEPIQVMPYIGAIKRHIDAYVDGQDLAEDSGIHHLAHALAGLNIIADSLALGTLIDNRPPKGPAADMLRAQDRSQPTDMPAFTEDEVLGRDGKQICRAPVGTYDGVEGGRPWCPIPCPHEGQVMAQGTLIMAEEWGAGDGEVYTHGEPFHFNCTYPGCFIDGHKRRPSGRYP